MSEEPVSPQQLVVAVRRSKRKEAPLDWIEKLKHTPGVSVSESPSRQRVVLQVEPEAVQGIFDEFGTYCLIEPIIEHHPLEDSKEAAVVSDKPQE